jgi:glyoxylase-like metal-dependent hydrolase (beta-lactamase superfamily II)
VRTILARNASAWTGPTGNNTYLLPGARPALIDAGVGHPEHIDEVASALAGAPLAAVLLTHHHPDHVNGVPALLERWPSVEILRQFRDGDIVRAGDRALRAIHTPGHTPEHFCFHDEVSGDLFCGDLVRAGGTIVIPASRGGNLRDYLDSLSRVRALRPRRLLPGHGPAIDDPQAAIEGYIAHRAEREGQIVEALRRGAATPQQLVAPVYGTLPDGLQSAAADSILAHLIKLQEESRAATDAEGKWSLTLAP